MAITKNLLPRCVEGHDTQQAKLNSWEKMAQERQFIDSIDTTGGDLSDAAKFNLLVSSVPSPWARVHLTQHAIRENIDSSDTRTLSQFYAFMRSEWRGLVAAYALYPEYFELTRPIELSARDMSARFGRFDILSTYSEMLFENEALWKYERGPLEKPKMQLLYYHNGDQRCVVGGTSPFSILFTGMNYEIPVDEQRIYWVVDNKFQDPADVKFETYYKRGEAKFNDKHFNNLKKLYSFLNGVQKNCPAYIETLRVIWESEHGNNQSVGTTEAKCNDVEMVINIAISTWMDEIRSILGLDADRSRNIPVNHKRPEGPLGRLLDIKTKYYWRNNAFYTRPIEQQNGGEDIVVDDVENLFINSDYLALWRDCAIPVTDSQGRALATMDHDYRLSPVHFLTAVEDGMTWFLAVPLSEYALTDVFKNEFVSIITGRNPNVRIEAEKNGKKVDVYLKARIDGEGDWVNIRNRSFNVETPNQSKKVFAWPNFCSSRWQKYYYYSEFPMNATTDVQMIPVFEDMADIENVNNTVTWDTKTFLRMIKYPNNATSDVHAYEILRTNKPLKRIKIRKNTSSGTCDLGWLVLRTVTYDVNAGDQQGLRIIQDTDNLSGTTVGFDFGSTNSCAYYSGQGDDDIRPIPFKNRRLAIIGFDNKPINTAEPNELLFISNEEPINHNGQIKSWLHEHDQSFIDPSRLGEELVGGVPVNETNITVKSMDRYNITTNAGKLHYNMKWLVDGEGINRKKAFMKMTWIQICADLFAENLYPETLNWSYPSAMGSRDMSALKAIFSRVEYPYPDPQNGNNNNPEENAYTEAEAVCSYFLSKNISLENNKLFVGIDIGGTTSDILVLGRENNTTPQPQVLSPIPEPQPVEQVAVATYPVDYDELSRPELCELVRQRGLAGKVDLDELSRREIVDFLKSNEPGQVDYDELSRPELCELVRQRGLAGKVDLDELSRQGIVDFLKSNEPGQVDYDELSRPELCELIRQRGLAGRVDVDELSRAQLVDFLKSNTVSATVVSTPSARELVAETPASSNQSERGRTGPRLYTQCSVRMAAGVFFDAIIGSKKFRDCIRNFHASRETRINVVDIDTIDVNPSRAPYYLNNIFDQLHGDREFKSFYGYLNNNVPFVFTLPAYIVGALLTYSGMLVRNAILTQKMEKVKEIHLRYFGKGGRLFEWLFFTFDDDQVKDYLNKCFEVGVKNELINKAFGRSKDYKIKCIFDNCADDRFGENENSENKSEVAMGLVSPRDVMGINPIQGIFDDNDETNIEEYDARKQEVIGEIGLTRNNVLLDELTLVDDNFYKDEGDISMPQEFKNFTKFVDTFIKFVGLATNIYGETSNLKNKIENVANVRTFINRDTEFKKYMESIKSGKPDSYRMPIFIATALFYLEEVLLKEVFGK